MRRTSQIPLSGCTFPRKRENATAGYSVIHWQTSARSYPNDFGSNLRGQFWKFFSRFQTTEKSADCTLEHTKDIQQYKWFIEGDIKGFFDNIDHEVLIAILSERISDMRFLRLIRKFLNAGYVEDWVFHKSYSGTPQGGIISPILANIYLDKFDKYIKEYTQNSIREKGAKKIR